MREPSDCVVFIAVPAFGYQVSGGTALSLFRLAQRLQAVGVKAGITMQSYPDIVEARNTLLSIWYYSFPDFTHLLFIDADMVFDPDLIVDMLLFDKPLVGCAYRRKKDQSDWVVKPLDDPQQNVEHGFMPVQAVGMGVALISRGCITFLTKKYPQLVHDVPSDMPPDTFGGQKLSKVFRCFDKIPFGYGNVSEDFSFCQRFTEVGGKVYANIAHPIGHLGTKNYHGSLLAEIEANGGVYDNRRKKATEEV